MRVLRRSEQIPRFRQARRAKALIEAINARDEPLALWLLKHGVDPHARDPKGRSALWWAATFDQANIIRELVKRGAKLPDDALMGPVNAGDERTVRFLIQSGANVNCIASQYSPVGWFYHREVLLTRAIGCAAHDPMLESISILLIRAGARVNRGILASPIPGLHNRSMLALAACDGQLKTVKALLTAGARVNRRDNFGRTALFDALEQGRLPVAKALLRAGARTGVRDLHGLTPAASLRRTEQSRDMISTQLCIGHGIKIEKAQLDKEAAACQRLRSRMLALLDRYT